MSRKGVTKFTPHMLDEPCFDNLSINPPKKLSYKKKVETDKINAKQQEHKEQRLRRYRNGYRGSVSDGFRRYVIVDKTPVVSTPPVVDQPK